MRFASAAVSALCGLTISVTSAITVDDNSSSSSSSSSPSLPTFQSGPSVGNTYAGGLVYDSGLNVFYATGATYQPLPGESSDTHTDTSSCFLTLLSTASGEGDINDNNDKFRQQHFGTDDTIKIYRDREDTTTDRGLVILDETDSAASSSSYDATACSSLTIAPDADSSILLAGFVEEALGAKGTFLTTHIGNGYSGSGSITGGASLDTSPVTYPVAITTDRTANEDGSYSVYVATMSSHDTVANFSAIQGGASSSSMPNWTTSGSRKFGSGYSLTVYKLTGQQHGVPKTFTVDWVKDYDASITMIMEEKASGTIAPATSPADIYVGGLMVHDDGYVYIVGSTRGSGDAFGEGGGITEDGFITKLDRDSGELDGVVRLGKSDDSNDLLTNICHDPNDPSGFYVVGATAKGTTNGDLFPKISRIDATDMTEKWMYVLDAVSVIPNVTPVTAYALSCKVSGDVVYVAGEALDGTRVSGADVSYGGDDVFVAQIDIMSNMPVWVKQVGSSQRDELSQNNGLTLDAHDNPVLYGHTNGNLFREKLQEEAKSTDIFAVTFSKEDGSHTMPIDDALQVGGADADADTGSDTDSDANTDSDTDAGSGTDSDADTDSNTEVDSDTDSDDSDNTSSGLNFDDSLLGAQIEGPIYAGGMAYSPQANKVYFTGSLYDSQEGGMYSASDCFVGEMDLSSSTTKVVPIVGDDMVPEACSAIALTDVGGEAKAFLIANTEFGGLGTGLADPASEATTRQFGNIVEILLDGTLTVDSVKTGYLIGDEVVTYPVAIAAEQGTENLYVVSMASSDASSTADNEIIKSVLYPDLTSGGLRRFGAQYYLRFTKVNIEGQVVAEESYETDDSSSVYTSGVAIVGNHVIIVGSTRGSGGVFGSKEGSDMDGFILRLDDTVGDSFGGSMFDHSRINSANSEDDWVTQICTDPNDTDSFYVVGATKGYSTLGSENDPTGSTIAPMIIKMSTSAMEVQWWTQIEVDGDSNSDSTVMDATAYGCAVNDGHVYMAGVVQDGARIVSPDNGVQPSMGKNDLFVAKVDLSSGDLSWARQFGTSQNDRLGQGGGVAVDASGNLLLLGQTEGDLYPSVATESRRGLLSSSAISDLIVLSVSPDGSFRSPLEEDETPEDETTESGDDPVPSPTLAPAPVTAPVAAPVEVPVEAPVATPVEAPVEAPVSVADNLKPSSEKSDDSSLPLVLILIGATLVGCAGFVFCLRASRQAEDRATQRKMLGIFKYLHAYDVDDIDIHRSPTGGYHGTYLNGLANGIEKHVDGEETTPTNLSSRPTLSHASVAEDYMFMSKRKVNNSYLDDDEENMSQASEGSQTGLSSLL